MDARIISLGSLQQGEVLQRPADPPEKAHHAPNGNGFLNPWPSYSNDGPKIGFKQFVEVNWTRRTETVPVPEDISKRPVQVVKADFTQKPGLEHLVKAVWIGHASWLLEFPSTVPGERGITVLCDPVFSERVSPVSFTGPKRFTPTPCTVDELPFIDAIAISHSHYDHLDHATIRDIWQKQKYSANSRRTRFFVPLGIDKWILSNFPGIPTEDVVALDWWDGRTLSRLDDRLRVYCTPSQHSSARTPFDKDKALWSSWLFHFTSSTVPELTVYFAGDTGYRHVPTALTDPSRYNKADISVYPGKEALARLPVNPTFKQIGQLYPKGLDLALIPIGCFNPVDWLSNYHAAPWDSVEMHLDLKARTSVAMHYGVIRGGVSAAFEPIDAPVFELREACERNGVELRRTRSPAPETGAGEFVLCSVGQTLLCQGRKNGE